MEKFVVIKILRIIFRKYIVFLVLVFFYFFDKFIVFRIDIVVYISNGFYFNYIMKIGFFD